MNATARRPPRSYARRRPASGRGAAVIGQQRAENVLITNRNVYDRARSAGHDETALWNTHGEIAEAATANTSVERDGGTKVTPHVACGLLAGTFRAELLARGAIRERL